MYKEKAKDFDTYPDESVWYFYTIFCPDELVPELEQHSQELNRIAQKINEKVLARSKKLKVMNWIYDQSTFHECDRYYRIYLEEVVLHTRGFGKSKVGFGIDRGKLQCGRKNQRFLKPFTKRLRDCTGLA